MTSVFRKIEYIGSGGYGDIYRVERKSDHKIGVLKIITIKDSYNNEVKMLSTLKHPGIVEMYDHFECTMTKREWVREEREWKSDSDELSETNEPKDMSGTSNRDVLSESKSLEELMETEYSDRGNIYCKLDIQIGDDGQTETKIQVRDSLEDSITLYCIFMEYIPGCDLYSSYVNLEDIKSIIKQLIDILEYIHKQDIVYHDLKPENIIVDFTDYENPKVKLIDFGLSAHLDNPCTNLRGTPDFIPPEMIGPNKGSTFAHDIWSLGILVYELLFRETPFSADTNSKTMRKIVSGIYSFPQDNSRYSASAESFISRILRVNPKERMSLKECSQHDFLTGIIMCDN